MYFNVNFNVFFTIKECVCLRENSTEDTWPAIYRLYFNMRVFDLTIILMFSGLIKRFIAMSNPFNDFTNFSFYLYICTIFN